MIENEAELTRTPTHEHALQAIASGIEAAHPRSVVAESLTFDGSRLEIGGERYELGEFEELVVLGGGKAAGHAAVALETLLGDRIDRGVVVTDTPTETETIEVIEGTHPLPSKANIEGTERLLELAETATEETLVLVVVAGGGSALLCAPADGIAVEAYRDVTDQLLRSGATIDDINAVRKHVSRIKGGQLARTLAPATTVGLVFSDVVGNRLDVIASGPTAPDTTSYGDALAVLERYEITVPAAVEGTLTDGKRGDRPETPGDDDDAVEQVRNRVLADNRTALDAAAETCEALGYTPVILSSRIEGEAREVGTVHAGIVAEWVETGEPFAPPFALLSGGEATVTVRGDGRGGPNQEFALRMAIEGAGTDSVVASVDTDGIDGATDVAGALVDGETVEDRSVAASALDDNDAFGYLNERDALIRTGQTGTNVNDLRLVLAGEV